LPALGHLAERTPVADILFLLVMTAAFGIGVALTMFVRAGIDL
jgi:hypothetical protein